MKVMLRYAVRFINKVLEAIDPDGMAPFVVLCAGPALALFSGLYYGWIVGVVVFLVAGVAFGLLWLLEDYNQKYQPRH